jgi:glycine cleavage system regulatory protein
MQSHAILTILTDDKPGIVELVANAIERVGGSWVDSHMQHVHGKFAGVVVVSIGSNMEDALKLSLEKLPGDDIHLQLAWANSTESEKSVSSRKRIHVIGPDRTGIVKEISSAMAERSINLMGLVSECSSTPWTGEPLFQAEAEIDVPAAINFEELIDCLQVIAEELGLEITISD